jgi:predicted enzyme related to lactoylglutathione lyase
MSQEEQHHRIDYVEWAVRDLAQAQDFYTAVFGWRFTEYGPEYASFDDGRLRGGIRSDLDAVSGGPLLVVYSGELEATEGRIKQHGGTIVKETFEFPGGRRFHFADPSGNELAVWSDR